MVRWNSRGLEPQGVEHTLTFNIDSFPYPHKLGQFPM